MTKYGMLLTTFPSKNAAQKLARLLVGENLAACVQMTTIESVYRWQGEIVTAPETLLLIKTRVALFDRAIARIKEKHPYSVPEIVGMEFTAGLPAYFDWIEQSTGPKEKPVSDKKAPVKKPPPKAKPRHPHSDGKVSAKKSRGMRTGISRPMRVK